MEPDPIPIQLRLAAIISLLSSSAQRGATQGKASALCAHLEAAALDPTPINGHLRNALEDTLAEWLAIECHPKSIPVEGSVVTHTTHALH